MTGHSQPTTSQNQPPSNPLSFLIRPQSQTSVACQQHRTKLLQYFRERRFHYLNVCIQRGLSIFPMHEVYALLRNRIQPHVTSVILRGIWLTVTDQSNALHLISSLNNILSPDYPGQNHDI
ncbi:hypothetical protein GEMRC1_001408 [Eukaryota sp. GEM-RC1]